MIEKLTILVGRLLLSQSLPVTPFMSVLCPLLRLLYHVCSVCVCFALVSCLLRLLSVSRPLHLRLLCLSELFALFASFMARFVCVCYLCRLRLLCFGELFAPFRSSMACSVCVCYASVSYLLYLRLLWLAPSASAVYTLSALSASAMPRSIVCSVYVFRGSLCLHLLSVFYPLCLHLLCFGELSTPFASFVTRFISVYYLCLICSAYVLSFIIFIVNSME